ncbi:MAG: hypothetical protein IPM91_21495 [Bacteroidetes bacterium]|nr:hypothetical protein [Bacteroidota bacterium]
MLHLLIISFYQYNEPASFIAAYGQNGKAILYSKTRSALTMQAIIQFPLIVLYVVFHEGEVLIPGILLLMLQISLVFVIIAKYAFYHPDSLQVLPNSINTYRSSVLLFRFLFLFHLF